MVEQAASTTSRRQSDTLDAVRAATTRWGFEITTLPWGKADQWLVFQVKQFCAVTLARPGDALKVEIDCWRLHERTIGRPPELVNSSRQGLPSQPR
jgi:hypothetical protein